MEKSLALAADVDEPVILPSPNSSSRTELYADPTFALAWENDVAHHISRHLLHLRRYRDMSQTAVAQAMSTSQSAVARIESGDGNFTMDTLERHINALGGRFVVSIQPKEYPYRPPTVWWETQVPPADTTSTDWVCRLAAINRTGTHAVLGFEKKPAASALTIAAINTW